MNFSAKTEKAGEQRMIYLDHAATSFQRPPAVARAVKASLQHHAGYGRSGHDAAVRAAEAVYDCRVAAAELFGLSAPERVIFCCNATHALNTAILGMPMRAKRAVISGYEHNAVYRPLMERAVRDGTETVIAASPLFDPDGAVRAFDQLLDERCGLCVCTMLSNVFGNRLPVEIIGRMCRERQIPFIVDASQAAGTLAVDAGRLSADVICMPGHKGLLGPAGTGMMLLCGERMPEPLLFGGTGGDSASPHQPPTPPERFESGTLNVPGICGLREGIRYIAEHREAIHAREIALNTWLRRRMAAIPGVRVYGITETVNSGLFSWNADGWDCERMAEALAENGIAVRAGLHCAPLAHRSAGTEGTVRVSFGWNSTQRETERFAETLETILFQK